MKKLLILLCMMLILGGITAMAEEKTLIDFNELKADYTPGEPKYSDTGEEIFEEDKETLVDFSTSAGAGFTPQELKELKTSLAINNWEVELASSSQTRENVSYSFTKEAITAKEVTFGGETIAEGVTVLGVRIHFPNPSFNSWAIIRPPFEIPAYMDKADVDAEGNLIVAPEEKGEGSQFIGKGVLKNVGPIKRIEIVVSGRNFPHGIGLIFQDENNEEQYVFFGYLNYNGWKRLVWENPNYVDDVRNRALMAAPLYPKSEPFIKLKGIIVYRDAAKDGGDFVTYVKDITVVYDLAVRDLEMDIDDEKLWGIMQAREEARRKAEIDRLGNLHVLRYLEELKMHKEEQ